MNLLKKIFGEKKNINIKGLGIFSARIRTNNPLKEIIWTSSIINRFEKEELVVLLEGNIKGPKMKDCEEVIEIINNVDSIRNNFITKINNDYRLKKKFDNGKISDYYLEYIGPWLKNEHSYELSLINKQNSSLGLGAIWKSNDLEDIQIFK